jgi:protein-disulfide isomerase
MSRSVRRGLAAAAAMLIGGPALAAPTPSSDDMSLGAPNARVQIVEYASLSCPHCAYVNEALFPALKAKYVDTGRARYIVKEMLTPPAQVAAAGWLLARCAGPKRYFRVMDQVFRSQGRWRTGAIKPIFVEIGKANGVSETRLQACLSDEKAIDALNDRTQRASGDGVEGTPTFFINGRKLEGDLTLATFDAAIAAADR